MRLRNLLALFLGVALAFMLFQPAARADQWNQMTELKFNQPVELPHVVLPAGSYWFVLENSPSSRDVVDVFSHNWKHEYATFFTVPTTRPDSTDQTVLIFAERPHDQPEALLKWYYPGRLTGHEFLYSPRHERRFARDPKRTVEANGFSSRS